MFQCRCWGCRVILLCLRFLRLSSSQCTLSIKNNKEFNDLVDYLCNDGGWYIKQTVEGGLIDWDFISQDNPEDYFVTRLY